MEDFLKRTANSYKQERKNKMSYLKDAKQKTSLDKIEDSVEKITINPYDFKYLDDNIFENVEEFGHYIKLDEHEKLLKDIFSSLKSEEVVDKRILIAEALFKRYNAAINSHGSVHGCLSGVNKSVAELAIAFIIEHDLKDEFYAYADKRKHGLICAMSVLIENLIEYMDIFAFDSGSELFNNCNNEFKPTLYNKVEAAFNDGNDYYYTESSSYVGKTPYWDLAKRELDYIISGGEYQKSLMQKQMDMLFQVSEFSYTNNAEAE